MSTLDEGDLVRRLDRYREVASGIESRLDEARDSLAGPVAEAFDFLNEVEALLVEVESDSVYAEALERTGARGLLERLEALRRIVSMR